MHKAFVRVVIFCHCTLPSTENQSYLLLLRFSWHKFACNDTHTHNFYIECYLIRLSWIRFYQMTTLRCYHLIALHIHFITILHDNHFFAICNRLVYYNTSIVYISEVHFLFYSSELVSFFSYILWLYVNLNSPYDIAWFLLRFKRPLIVYTFYAAISCTNTYDLYFVNNHAC